MTAKHTPGRWFRNIPPASRYPTIFAGRSKHVARVVVTGLPADEIEGNANLIAAAPELLQALERARRYVAVNLDEVVGAGYAIEIVDRISSLLANIDAAIAKAKP